MNPVRSMHRPLLEWAGWSLIALAAWGQTGSFDAPFDEYAFGAAGWPRAVCLAILAGATAQLLLAWRAGNGGGAPAAAGETDKPRLALRLGILVLPLAYLYLMPVLGFFLTTPVFILFLLLLLQVRTPAALAGVTCVVYGLVLLTFTRLFYVALPVGRIDPFYSLNTLIVGLVRTGL